MKSSLASSALIAGLSVTSALACSESAPGPSGAAGASSGAGAGALAGASGAAGAQGISGAGAAGDSGAGGGGNQAGASGTAGSATAGSAGAAGTSGNPPMGVVPAEYARGNSPGCGKPLPEGQEPRARFRTDIASTTVNEAWLDEFNEDASEYMNRNYSVKVPLNYDPNTPYVLNIIGGGCGGDGQGWGGQSAWPDNDQSPVIHVHPNYKGGCYQDDGAFNPEEAFFDVWFPQVMERYCIDQERVFMTGYSSGAWNAITHGCSRSRFIRAHGQSLGGLRERRSECQGPVAALFAADVLDRGNPVHDTIENSSCTGTEAEGCYRGETICTGSHSVPNSGCVNEGIALARERTLELNGCVGREREPWGGTVGDVPGAPYRYVTFINDGLKPGDPVPQNKLDSVKDWFPVAADGTNNQPACYKYTGCPAEFPVVWCETYDNGHGGKEAILTQAADDGLNGYRRFFEKEVPRYQ